MVHGTVKCFIRLVNKLKSLHLELYDDENLTYSISEYISIKYCAFVWPSSTHTSLVDAQVNIMKVITDVRYSRIHQLPVISIIATPKLYQSDYYYMH